MDRPRARHAHVQTIRTHAANARIGAVLRRGIVDPQSLFNIAISLVSAAGGWMLRTFYTDIRNLEQSIAAHKVEVARDYATNADLTNIDRKLDKILDVLAQKADRPNFMRGE